MGISLHVRDDLQRRVDAAHLVDSEMSDALSESARVDGALLPRGGIPRIYRVDTGVDEVIDVAGRESSVPVKADCCYLRVRHTDRASSMFSGGNDFRVVRRRRRIKRQNLVLKILC